LPAVGLNGTYDAAEETFELPGRWPSICKAAVRRRWPRRALLAAGCAHGRPKEKTSMQIESLRDMYIAELQELASVERQIGLSRGTSIEPQAQKHPVQSLRTNGSARPVSQYDFA
jgi:hypothetical protein